MKISLNNLRLAVINCDKGIDNLQIEILPDSGVISECIFPLESFLEILEKAKAVVQQCIKAGDDR